MANSVVPDQTTASANDNMIFFSVELSTWTLKLPVMTFAYVIKYQIFFFFFKENKAWH